MGIEPSKGRVLELPKATKEEIKAISRVVSAIMAARVMSFEKIYAAAVGSMEGYGLEDKSNLGKGSIAQWKAAKFYRWIVENHLALGCQIAPEVFDPSLLTRWSDLVRTKAIYGCFTHRIVGALGLTERSSKQPIAELPIRSTDQFYFELVSNLDGMAIALEQSNGQIYPFSLHENQVSLTLPVKVGSQFVPRLPGTDNAPDLLSDTDDQGLRCYYILIATPELIEECSKGLSEGHPISAEKLDQIALAFNEAKPGSFELHRLNVVFTA
ncbi:hypothetical protein OEG84_16875 [Hoeflea sp. G2-23]|uniref:DUF4384 domain-containing protein n=1 Tax=Hoeflea algicola TaxID=2983763 RepID=A0ABT3ZC05_9HYPH|nr:hypothetical protein [Hoeflea algicola]MCY0149336.1 hypothetical protein [Hoeflea algicola]